MMTRAQLQRIAGHEKVGLGVLEKDYVITEVLRSLGVVRPMANTFVFKGGTALRKVYFPAWRYSEDLDFTVTEGFPTSNLEEHLQDWYRTVEADSGVRVATRDVHKPDGFARVRIQFQGPLGQPATIFMDLTFDEPVLVEPVRRAILTEPFPLEPGRILVYALEELAAEKLRSILERGESRDYYDVWRLLRDHADALDQQLTRRLYVQKCAHKHLKNADIEALLDPERVAGAERYWNADLPRQLESLPDFRAVVAELRVLLRMVLT